MNVLHALMSRISTRTFTDEPISKEKLDILLSAAMAGPTAKNQRDWAFLVVENKKKLQQMAEANGKYAGPLKNAAMGIMICGDISRQTRSRDPYWIVDCAIAAQNIILAATELGIGSVWLGTYPNMERVRNQQQLFALPEEIIPHTIIALGYPDDEAIRKGSYKKLFEPQQVHYERW